MLLQGFKKEKQIYFCLLFLVADSPIIVSYSNSNVHWKNRHLVATGLSYLFGLRFQRIITISQLITQHPFPACWKNHPNKGFWVENIIYLFLSASIFDSLNWWPRVQITRTQCIRSRRHPSPGHSTCRARAWTCYSQYHSSQTSAFLVR